MKISTEINSITKLVGAEKAVELVAKAGGTVVCKAAVLAEGDAADRTDIVYLEKLPLFFS